MRSIFNNLKTTIWRYYAFEFFVYFMFSSAVLIPFYTEWGNISFTQITILQSWFVMWIFLLEVPTGAVADYLGRKYSLTMGAFAVTLGALLYGSIPSFEVFLIAEFIFAMSIALVSGADQALLYDALKEEGKEKESAKVFGRAYSFRMLGMLISAPIGSLIASRFGLNVPMLLSAVPFFIAALIAISIKEPKVEKNISETRRYIDVLKKGFLFFRGHKTLRLLALDAIIVSNAAYFVVWLYQPLLKNLNIPIFYFGFFHAVMMASEIVIASNFKILERLLGSAKSLIRFSAVVTAISFFIAAIFPNLVTVVIFIIIAGGFGLTRLELISAYMNKFIPSGERATVLSSISMFRRFGLIFLNPLIGLTVDRSLSLALLIIGTLPLLVFLFSPIEHEMFEND